MRAWTLTAFVWLAVSLGLGLPALETVAGLVLALAFGAVAPWFARVEEPEPEEPDDPADDEGTLLYLISRACPTPASVM